MNRTSRQKPKRRRAKLPRRSVATSASENAASVASLKKKKALLTRKLNEVVAKHTATSRELSESLEREKVTSRELSESLERETATAQVLGIISSSPTDLEPLFETILANATRLCAATHAALWLREGDGFRVVARHGTQPAGFVERGLLFRPGPGVPAARAATTLRAVHVADLRTEQAYLDRDLTQLAGLPGSSPKL
jgi:hypothetical protein